MNRSCNPSVDSNGGLMNRSCNPSGPVAYFITFRTYGTWLHGDERGSSDRKYANVPGTPVIAASRNRQRWEQKQMQHPAVWLNSIQREIIDRTIREVIEYNQWLLHALSIQKNHVHVVVTAHKLPEAALNSFKAWCTRRMREAGYISKNVKPWSRHGSTRWVWTESDLKNVCMYVNR